jgi:hypothetical protein
MNSSMLKEEEEEEEEEGTETEHPQTRHQLFTT